MDPRDVRVVRRETVFEGRLLHVERQRVEMPGGRSAELETIRHPGAAAALPFLDGERVLLLRQYRHAAGRVLIEIPAGLLDVKGEAPAECALREVREETGYRAARVTPLGSIHSAPGFSDERVFLFEAHDLEPGETSLEPGEWLETFELGLREALALVRGGEITDAKTVAALLHAAWRRGLHP